MDNYRALGLPSEYVKIKLHILKSIQYNFTQNEIWDNINSARRQPRETLLSFANRLLTLGCHIMRMTGKPQEYVNPHLIMAFKTAMPEILHNFINPVPSPDETSPFVTYFQREIEIVSANPQFKLRNVDVMFEKIPKGYVNNSGPINNSELALPSNINNDQINNRCLLCNQPGHRQFECTQNPRNYTRSDYVRRNTMENMLTFRGSNQPNNNSRNFLGLSNSPYNQNSNPNFPRFPRRDIQRHSFGNNQNMNSFGNNQNMNRAGAVARFVPQQGNRPRNWLGPNNFFGNPRPQNQNFGSYRPQNQNFWNPRPQNQNFGNPRNQNQNFGNFRPQNQNFGSFRPPNQNFGNPRFQNQIRNRPPTYNKSMAMNTTTTQEQNVGANPQFVNPEAIQQNDN